MNDSRIQKFLYIIIALLVVVAVVGGGFIAFNAFRSKTTTMTTSSDWQNPVANEFKKELAKPFFTNQSATTTGKILAMKGNMLTVESVNGEKQEFPASKSVSIYFPSPGKPSTPSADLKKITLNKQALINFSMEEGRLVLTSVFFTD